MLDAIAAAAELPAADVRRAAMFTGSAGLVARIALAEGAAGLARFAIALQRPVQPMLATPAEDIAVAMTQLGTAAVEWEVDGARVQVHKSADGIGQAGFSSLQHEQMVLSFVRQHGQIRRTDVMTLCRLSEGQARSSSAS